MTSRADHRALVVLPCRPCPHSNPCCSRGTNLSRDEAEEIGVRWGWETLVRLGRDELVARFSPGEPLEPGTLWESGGPEWCTALTPSGCVFLEEDGDCRLYDTPAYPRVCRDFPWRDLSGTSPAVDSHLCPEVCPSPIDPVDDG